MERPTARHLKVEHVLKSPFIKGEGWDVSAIAVGQEKISLVNILGIVVALQPDSCIVDDGSGELLVRAFSKGMLTDITVGTTVLLIGRIREHDGQRHLVPEIIKSTAQGWLEVRRQKKETVRSREESPIGALLSRIKSLDNGDGALVEDIVGGEQRLEGVIRDLMLRGEIFEVRPGRIKVLE